MTLTLAGQPRGLGQVFCGQHGAASLCCLGQVRAWRSPGFTARRRRGFQSPGKVAFGRVQSAAVVAGSTPKGSEGTRGCGGCGPARLRSEPARCLWLLPVPVTQPGCSWSPQPGPGTRVAPRVVWGSDTIPSVSIQVCPYSVSIQALPVPRFL